MESIKLRAQVGEDGILKLEVPVGQPNIEMEVLVVMQPVGKKINLKLTSADIFLPTETAEEIEQSLAQIFTPAELAEMAKVDLNNLPIGSKSLSEMIIEDREDRL